jgi:hypothetical protein
MNSMRFLSPQTSVMHSLTILKQFGVNVRTVPESWVMVQEYYGDLSPILDNQR